MGIIFSSMSSIWIAFYSGLITSALVFAIYCFLTHQCELWNKIQIMTNLNNHFNINENGSVANLQRINFLIGPPPSYQSFLGPTPRYDETDDHQNWSNSSSSEEENHALYERIVRRRKQ